MRALRSATVIGGGRAIGAAAAEEAEDKKAGDRPAAMPTAPKRALRVGMADLLRL